MIHIGLALLNDWETGAPEPDPNTDTAFVPDEAIAPGSGNVFADLGLPDAARRLAEADSALIPDDPNWPPTALPAPWQMSIRELDSWNDFYRTRLRGQGRGCGALTAEETTHRAEVEANINQRHEARRHSAFPR